MLKLFFKSIQQPVCLENAVTGHKSPDLFEIGLGIERDIDSRHADLGRSSRGVFAMTFLEESLHAEVTDDLATLSLLDRMLNVRL